MEVATATLVLLAGMTPPVRVHAEGPSSAPTMSQAPTVVQTNPTPGPDLVCSSDAPEACAVDQTLLLTVIMPVFLAATLGLWFCCGWRLASRYAPDALEQVVVREGRCRVTRDTLKQKRMSHERPRAAAPPPSVTPIPPTPNPNPTNPNPDLKPRPQTQPQPQSLRT